MAMQELHLMATVQLPACRKLTAILHRVHLPTMRHQYLMIDEATHHHREWIRESWVQCHHISKSLGPIVFLRLRSTTILTGRDQWPDPVRRPDIDLHPQDFNLALLVLVDSSNTKEPKEPLP